MTSHDLTAEGFACWTKFNRHVKADVLGSAPRSFGVYVIRKTEPVQCIRGQSDIIYIGSACNEKGLRGRIGQYYSPGWRQSTNLRILKLTEDSDDYEIGWRQTTTKSEAVGLEQLLLERFFNDHGERPSENRKG